jgi:hypothetical protein
VVTPANQLELSIIAEFSLFLRVYFGMVRLTVSIILSASFTTTGLAQVTSVAGGDWTNPATWSCGCVPDNTGPAIQISHAVQLSGFTASVDDLSIQVGGSLTVNNGGILNNLNLMTGATASNLIFNNNSEYQHNQNGGTVPTASWNSGSVCRITGITGATLEGFLSPFIILFGIVLVKQQ